MTQDTRKDRRVKIVSLNVRYKSATVDEFIENHAHDVSRGGIFIKTANPFPAGTLLKFEIRLASDQAVIAGVGRVVWKRDAGSSNGERPAGMGVKFIKIDEPSKAVIDRLMNTRSDAGIAFESNDETPAAAQPATRTTPPARPAPQSARPGPDSATAVAAAPVALSADAKRSPPPDKPPPIRKATMMGLGASASSQPSSPPARAGTASSAPPRPTPLGATPTVPPRPSTGGAMFPKSLDTDRPPKEEQTVMRQAAELLEDALREAGGSMEEIGTNPLFSGHLPSPAATPSPKPLAPVTPGSEWTTADTPQALSATVAAIRAQENRTQASPAAATAEAPARESPAPARTEAGRPSAPSAPARETPASQRAVAAAPRASAPAPARKKSGSGAVVIVGLAAAAIAGAVMFRDRLLGGLSAPAPEPAPSAARAAPTPMASAPSVIIAPATSSTAIAAAQAISASAAQATPAATASAAPHPSTATASSANDTTSAPTAAAPARSPKPAAPRPAAPATATATPPAATGASAEAPAAAEKPGSAAPPPEAAAQAASASPPPTKAPAAPRAKGPSKPADDNPY